MDDDGKKRLKRATVFFFVFLLLIGAFYGVYWLLGDREDSVVVETTIEDSNPSPNQVKVESKVEMDVEADKLVKIKKEPKSKKNKKQKKKVIDVKEIKEETEKTTDIKPADDIEIAEEGKLMKQIEKKPGAQKATKHQIKFEIDLDRAISL